MREPLLVVAAVEARVCDGTGDGGGRPDGVVEQRLVEVHEADALLVEKTKELVVLKRRVPHFERHRVAGEGAEQRREARNRLVRVLETPGELQKDRAEAAALHQRIEVVAEIADVVGCQLRLFMREAAKHLGCEAEIGVVFDAAHPAFRVGYRRNPIERRVDLDRVEETGEVSQVVEFGAVLRVDGALPIRIAPSGGPDPDQMSYLEHHVSHCIR